MPLIFDDAIFFAMTLPRQPPLLLAFITLILIRHFRWLFSPIFHFITLFHFLSLIFSFSRAHGWRWPGWHASQLDIDFHIIDISHITRLACHYAIRYCHWLRHFRHILRYWCVIATAIVPFWYYADIDAIRHASRHFTPQRHLPPCWYWLSPSYYLAHW
jgi:hypothetical protein